MIDILKGGNLIFLTELRCGKSVRQQISRLLTGRRCVVARPIFGKNAICGGFADIVLIPYALAGTGGRQTIIHFINADGQRGNLCKGNVAIGIIEGCGSSRYQPKILQDDNAPLEPRRIGHVGEGISHGKCRRGEHAHAGQCGKRRADSLLRLDQSSQQRDVFAAADGTAAVQRAV